MSAASNVDVDEFASAIQRRGYREDGGGSGDEGIQGSVLSVRWRAPSSCHSCRILSFKRFTSCRSCPSGTAAMKGNTVHYWGNAPAVLYERTVCKATVSLNTSMFGC